MLKFQRIPKKGGLDPNLAMQANKPHALLRIEISHIGEEKLWMEYLASFFSLSNEERCEMFKM